MKIIIRKSKNDIIEGNQLAISYTLHSKFRMAFALQSLTIFHSYLVYLTLLFESSSSSVSWIIFPSKSLIFNKWLRYFSLCSSKNSLKSFTYFPIWLIFSLDSSRPRSASTLYWDNSSSSQYNSSFFSSNYFVFSSQVIVSSSFLVSRDEI